jgi:serine phosphatase RsbU (regulator of sigma subunit)
VSRPRERLGVLEAHAMVHRQGAGSRFVTALIGRLDLHTGRSTVVNAGFPPIHRLQAGRVDRLSFAPQRPLRLFPDTVYRGERMALQPGDRPVPGLARPGPAVTA